MTRIVIDTNVLVSTSIKSGYSYQIIKAVTLTESIIACISEEVMNEYERVIRYERIQKKYPHYFLRASENIALLRAVATVFVPLKHFTVIVSDITDNIFLDLAYAAEAHYLITGNHSDFTITDFENTRIVSPKTFCDLYNQEQL